MTKRPAIDPAFYANPGLPIPRDPLEMPGPGRLRYEAQGSVPNNFVIAQGVEQELAQQGQQVLRNPYGDWATPAGAQRGILPTYAQQPPRPGFADRMSPQPDIQNELIPGQKGQAQMSRPFDGSAPPAKLPSPLDNPEAQFTAFDRSKLRYGTTGTVVSPALPPQPPPGREDLQRVQQPVMLNEGIAPYTVLGDPSQAQLPRPGGTPSLQGGRPVDTPPPAKP